MKEQVIEIYNDTWQAAKGLILCMFIILIFPIRILHVLFLEMIRLIKESIKMFYETDRKIFKGEENEIKRIKKQN